MTDVIETAEIRTTLTGKMTNAILLLNDADSFLWLRQQGLHETNPYLGGGNWLILLGALSVLNLLGKISFISDERLVRCDESWFMGRRKNLRELGQQSVSEKHGFLNLSQLGGWNISPDDAEKFWDENRHPLSHVGSPRMGSGVVGRELGDYENTVQQIRAGNAGPLFFKLPASMFPNLAPDQVPIFANSDLLVHATRELLSVLNQLIDSGSDDDLRKVLFWCED